MPLRAPSVASGRAEEIDPSPCVQYDWDATADLVSFRGGLATLLGYTPEALGRDWGQWVRLVHPEDAAAFARELSRTNSASEPFEWQYRRQRADGSYLAVRDTAQWVPGADGRRTRLIGFVRPAAAPTAVAAALPEAEQQLRENASFVADVLNSVPIHLLVLDEIGTIIAVNDAWRSFVAASGRSGPLSFLGDNFFAVAGAILGETAAATLTRVRAGVRAATSGEAGTIDLDYTALDNGVLRSFALRASRLGRGRRGAVLSHEDVTSRKETAIEVERQARFARYNPNPVLELSAAGEVTFANDAAQAMAAAFEETAVGRILPRNLTAVLRQCLETGEPALRLETLAKGRTVSWSFFPITAASVVHCYGGDITERKRLEEQFRHAQRLEAVGKLSGGIAHDFNNLLTVIQAHVGLLRPQWQATPEATQSLNGIADAADRASNLTRQLLTFSRKQPLQLRVVDLNQIVRGMSSLLTRVFGEDVSIDFSYAPDPQPVLADPGMLEQVLMNLAVNARDAMPHGGRLEIRVLPVQPRPGAAPESICLSVKDSGEGIAPEVMPQLFDPFFTTKEVGKGTGLGLATVYGIVQQHEGRIEVDSEVGQGATFRVFLPRSREPLEVAVHSAPVPDKKGTEVILLAEDEALVRELVVKMLTRRGYRVLAATNGLEARELWRTHRGEIRLLLTDLVMPGMGGVELAEEILADEPALRIVYMTGYSQAVAGRNSLLREGANFLGKPFTPDRLVNIVRASLDQPATRSPFVTRN